MEVKVGGLGDIVDMGLKGESGVWDDIKAPDLWLGGY